jgi:hypothetical protein
VFKQSLFNVQAKLLIKFSFLLISQKVKIQDDPVFAFLPINFHQGESGRGMHHRMHFLVRLSKGLHTLKDWLFH